MYENYLNRRSYVPPEYDEYLQLGQSQQPGGFQPHVVEGQPLPAIEEQPLPQAQPIEAAMPQQMPQQDQAPGGSLAALGLLRAASASFGGQGGQAMMGQYDAAEKAIRGPSPDERLKSQALYQQYLDAGAKRKKLAEEADPSSEASKNAALRAQAAYQTRANQLKAIGSQYAPFFEEAAKTAIGKSAFDLATEKPQLDKLASESVGFANAESRDQQLAQQGASLASQAEERSKESARQDAELGIRREELDLKKAALAAQAGRLHLSTDQTKLIANMAQDLQIFGRIGPLAEQAEKWTAALEAGTGKAMTGPMTGNINTLKKMLNLKDNSEFVDFDAAMSRLFSQERKFFAGSNVTESEMKNLAPMIPNTRKDSEQTIAQKLRFAQGWIEERQKLGMAQLKVGADGQTLDQSLIARHLSDSAKIFAEESELLKQFGGSKPKEPGSASKPAAKAKYIKQADGKEFQLDETTGKYKRVK